MRQKSGPRARTHDPATMLTRSDWQEGDTEAYAGRDGDVENHGEFEHLAMSAALSVAARPARGTMMQVLEDASHDDEEGKGLDSSDDAFLVKGVGRAPHHTFKRGAGHEKGKGDWRATRMTGREGKRGAGRRGGDRWRENAGGSRADGRGLGGVYKGGRG